MASANLLALQLLNIVLFVVPGLIGIKVYLWNVQQVDQFGRLDSVVYSLALSIGGILFLYLLFSLHIGRLAEFADFPATSLPLIIHGYLALLSVCLLWGIWWGRFQRHYWHNSFNPTKREAARMLKDGQWDELSNEVVTPFLRGHDRTRKEIWDYTFDDIYSDSHARVVTCKGDIIEGEIIQWGDTVQKRDLLIVNPEVVTFTGNGETEPDHPLGKYAYVHEQDISHIALTEDLNEGDESVAQQEVEEGEEDDETESVARDDLMDEYAQEIARREGYESVDDLLEALDIDTIDELLDTDFGHPIPEEDRE